MLSTSKVSQNVSTSTLDSLLEQAAIFFTLFLREAQRKQAGNRHQLARAGEQLRACVDRIEEKLDD